MTHDEALMTKRMPNAECRTRSIIGASSFVVLSSLALRHSSLATFLVITLVLAGSSPVFAHDSPDEEAAFLTLKMTRTGKTPALLIRRAAEYKAMGDLNKAAADLKEAIALEPKLPAAYADLSRIEFAQQKLSEACESVTRALALTENAGERPALFLLRAHIQAARGHASEALADCELSARRDDQDWYLIRSQLQSQLGKHDARVAGLKEGFQRNGSIVLEIEWVEAMIDAGQYRPALERVEFHLNRLRWRSSWLLRRARALRGLKADYLPDANAALAELNQRIRPDNPEPTLLVDRAMAFALLGRAAEANSDLTSAKERGMPPTSCARVEAILKSSGLASK
jgi:tetratricopeptide (TPR) repeat protein